MTDEQAFWDFADPLIAATDLEEGTMFGFRCLGLAGTFVAMPGHWTGGMVVKLPAARVEELVGRGNGTPVAPSGRVYTEWVEISDESLWEEVIEEALAFASA